MIDSRSCSSGSPPTMGSTPHEPAVLPTVRHWPLALRCATADSPRWTAGSLRTIRRARGVLTLYTHPDHSPIIGPAGRLGLGRPNHLESLARLGMRAGILTWTAGYARRTRNTMTIAHHAQSGMNPPKWSSPALPWLPAYNSSAPRSWPPEAGQPRCPRIRRFAWFLDPSGEGIARGS